MKDDKSVRCPFCGIWLEETKDKESKTITYGHFEVLAGSCSMHGTCDEKGWWTRLAIDISRKELMFLSDVTISRGGVGFKVKIGDLIMCALKIQHVYPSEIKEHMGSKKELVVFLLSHLVWKEIQDVVTILPPDDSFDWDSVLREGELHIS